MCVKRCMQCPLAQYIHWILYTTIMHFIYWVITCWCNHIPRGSHGHLGVKLVEFSIAHIFWSASCIELKLGTNDVEGITQQIITRCRPISMLGIFYDFIWLFMTLYFRASLFTIFVVLSWFFSLYHRDRRRGWRIKHDRDRRKGWRIEHNRDGGRGWRIEHNRDSGRGWRIEHNSDNSCGDCCYKSAGGSGCVSSDEV